MSDTSKAKIYLGVDGGGTHTRAAIATESRIIGTSASGPSNYHSVGEQTARENILAAVSLALHNANLSLPVTSAFFGMAGVVSESDRHVILQIAEDAGLAPRGSISVDHDLRIAHAGGLAGSEGIVVIAGTGSSSYGLTSNGESWRSGGWGHILDDVGGGYWLGLQGLIAVVRASDGRGENTLLSKILIASAGITDVREIIGIVGTSDAKSSIAGLAPHVLDGAVNGDAVASRIAKRGAKELALMITAVAGQLVFAATPIATAMCGGLFTNEFYRGLLLEALEGTNIRLQNPLYSPEIGALLLAAGLAGENINTAIKNWKM